MTLVETGIEIGGPREVNFPGPKEVFGKNLALAVYTRRDPCAPTIYPGYPTHPYPRRPEIHPDDRPDDRQPWEYAIGQYVDTT